MCAYRDELTLEERRKDEWLKKQFGIALKEEIKACYIWVCLIFLLFCLWIMLGDWILGFVVTIKNLDAEILVFSIMLGIFLLFDSKLILAQLESTNAYERSLENICATEKVGTCKVDLDDVVVTDDGPGDEFDDDEDSDDDDSEESSDEDEDSEMEENLVAEVKNMGPAVEPVLKPLETQLEIEKDFLPRNSECLAEDKNEVQDKVRHSDSDDMAEWDIVNM